MSNQIESQNPNRRIRVMFLRDKKGQPVGSLAIDLIKGETSSRIAYQIAVNHSKKDKFDRKKAHTIVKGRLESNPIFIENVPLDSNIHLITELVMRDIVQHHCRHPSQASQSAELWIKAIPEAPKTIPAPFEFGLPV